MQYIVGAFIHGRCILPIKCFESEEELGLETILDEMAEELAYVTPRLPAGTFLRIERYDEEEISIDSGQAQSLEQILRSILE